MRALMHISGERQLVPAVRIMREWAARLDCGTYPQAGYYLSQSDGTQRCFCVLGVLAEVMVEFGFMQAVETDRGRRVYGLIDSSLFGGSDETLPAVLDDVFCDSHGASLSFDYVGAQHCGLNAMGNLNDYEGVEFAEFAIIIREQFIPLMPADPITIH